MGGTDCGKSTVSRILINYAVRMGWSSLYVDLDPGQGSISPPGTIAATPVQLPVTVEDGYPLEVPLVYFHGHNSPSNNPEHFKLLLESMASAIGKRAVLNPSATHAGTIVNTMGWIEGLGYELLLHSIFTFKVPSLPCPSPWSRCLFKVDFLLVLDDEELYRKLDVDVRSACRCCRDE